MALLNILCYPDPRLHTVAKPVTQFDDALRTLVANMMETMYDAQGIGLAATQINVHQRVVVIDTSEERNQPLVLINPEITWMGPERVKGEEGCLSVPVIYDGVERATQVKVKAMDAEGQEVAPGERGELWMRGPQVMKGYWNNPKATAESITPEGWFKTGDAGYRDEDGYIYIHDRVKDMIITGGENVYPAEVESAIYGHPDVLEVAVIGVPDAKWGEAVKAVCVPKPGAQIDVESVMAWARERIAGFKVPRSVDVIEALPRNASGKILRKDLRAPYWAGYDRQVN